MTVMMNMLFAMLLGLPAMILHECGHVSAALICGVKVKRVGISWVGFFVQRESGPPWANLLISLSGPLVNLLLAAVLWSSMPSFAQVNLFIGIGSLVPFPKSDGKRILALFRSVGDQSRWVEQARTVSASRSQNGVVGASRRLTAT